MLIEIYIGFSTIISDFVSVVEYYDLDKLLKTEVSSFSSGTISDEDVFLVVRDQIIEQCVPFVKVL